MSYFIPSLSPSKGHQRPPTQYKAAQQLGGGITFLRDNFTVTTWLAIGATLHIVISLILGSKRAIWLPLAYLFVRLTMTFLQTVGLAHNKMMDNVLLAKTSAQLPDVHTGNYGPTPASRSITVFLVGARCNHPLGILAPGLAEMGNYFSKINENLSTPQAATEYGVIGITPWIGADRASNNGPMVVIYFESEEGLHKFAHDPIHAEAWKWMASHAKKYPHLAFWHESFTSEAGKWEAIYANEAPLGLGAGSVPVSIKDQESGKEEQMWYGTLVDASRGVLRSSRGRQRDESGHGDKVTMEERAYA